MRYRYAIMASIHRQKGKPHWFCAFYDGLGRRRFKSTGTESKSRANIICESWRRTSELARQGSLTQQRTKEIADEALEAVGEDGKPLSKYQAARLRELVEGTIDGIAKQAGIQIPRYSVVEYFAGWLKDQESLRKERTFARYKTVVDSFLDTLGTRRNAALNALGPEEVEAYRNSLANRLAPGTVNLSVKILRVALNPAWKKQLIDRNPAALVDIVTKEGPDKRRPFTLDEIKKILGVASQEWKAAVLFGLYCGLRLGDVANLTWANVDLAQQSLTLQTRKTGRTQSLPLAAPLLRCVEALPAGDTPDTPLFPSLAGKDVGQLSNQFYEIMTSAGLVPARTHEGKGKGRNAARQQNQISFHCLRHTATSLLKNAGVSDAIARDIIGHESEAVSRAYTHIDDATKRAAVGRLPDVTSQTA